MMLMILMSQHQSTTFLGTEHTSDIFASMYYIRFVAHAPGTQKPFAKYPHRRALVISLL